MFSPYWRHATPIAMLAALIAAPEARAQQSLPTVTVEAQRQPKPVRAPRTQRSERDRVTVRPVPRATPAAPVRSGTSPLQEAAPVAAARRVVESAPGATQVVAAESYRDTGRVSTIKDALEYVAGVFAQPKWGEDTRLSIRGSGLSRNFHLRGTQLYLDGVPFNTADGYGDFQEIDPGSYRFIEVYKGANALRFGANSLGGAINFVTPTGREANVNSASVDAGSFGFFRFNATAGGAQGPLDAFVSGTYQQQEGFRQHSSGQSERGSANIGYQINEDVETRFYFNANHIRQRIPGSVTRTAALTNPEVAVPANVINDQQRNIDSVRIANKTTWRIGEATTLEFGLFGVDRHLMHPIFQWLDYKYIDYGGFARVVDDRLIGGFRNRLTVGANVHNGDIDADQYANLPGAQKGALLSRTKDFAGNTSFYAENAFYVLPTVAIVAGTQFLHAVRERQVIVAQPGTIPGRQEFDLWSPKIGVLWEAAPGVQAFANISRSAEAPSFGEGANAQAIPFTSIRPQRATTYEIGTRGRLEDYRWDVALYRAEIRDELLCLFSSFGNCNVTNANRTVHQGVEIAGGAAILKSIFAHGAQPDRVWLNLAYTYNDFYFDRDATFGNNVLPGAPHHFVRAELLYRHPNGFFIGPNIEWVPEAYFVDSANTLKTDPYALVGAKMGVETKHLTFYVEGRNLANKAYISSASIIDKANPNSPLFEPGNGRAIYAGMRAKW
ncbi:vitamin B12/cobalamin outer membrane transporter [Variibacter gotjawalensis]|uniref:Vitamin B12/cobalamin outer membrane transporter n=1 Tax=Variibacter gotjawalensis TaxID=1333996 RepID=A0A0S3PWE7_9BRAD|nr:TonB-dependent receptor [Variibacter gotjawalensis]NIK46072.1 iron complex outermembrane receptor protein [Variibacter gotjawalensis]RZS47990.1 iron complex outermembrane receptor protein [Variibacter gotjawalensis]BAT60246.1 vitamin B12/cobalamin outer membrane transporter [Variibacter gotjawalensis]